MKILKKLQNNIPNPPIFWQQYLQLSFDLPQKDIKVDEMSFLAIDVESTGFNPKKDSLVSIGAVRITNNKIKAAESIELFIKQNSVSRGAVHVHEIIKDVGDPAYSEKEAIKKIIEFAGNSILVGHQINFDLMMINRGLKKITGGRLKNLTLDTAKLYLRTKGTGRTQHQNVSLDYICNELNIPLDGRHSAAGDAYITAILFLKLTRKLKARGVITTVQLFKHGML